MLCLVLGCERNDRNVCNEVDRLAEDMRDELSPRNGK